HKSKRLFDEGRKSHLLFLIDTGSDVSVISIKSCKQFYSHSEPLQLYAANGSPIKNFGQKPLEINLGLRRAFTFTFHVADTQNNIIGADVLAQLHLCPDLQSRLLIDGTTLLSRSLQLRDCKQPSISAINNCLDV